MLLVTCIRAALGVPATASEVWPQDRKGGPLNATQLTRGNVLGKMNKHRLLHAGKAGFLIQKYWINKYQYLDVSLRMKEHKQY